MTLSRTRLLHANMITAPWVGRAKGPVCLTCQQTVDAWGLAPGIDSPAPAKLDEQDRVIEEATRDYALLLVRHHDAEELRRVDMGSRNWDMRDVKRAIERCNWFDPRTVGEGEDAPLARRVAPVNDDEDRAVPVYGRE